MKTFRILLAIGALLAAPRAVAAERWASLGPEGAAVLALAVDLASASTLYAGTDGGGVFKSSDGGVTWTPSSLGLGDFSVQGLAVAAAPPTVFAGTVSGLYRSTDGAASWSLVGGLPRTVFNVIAVDPASSSVMYAVSTGAGLFKSMDGGGTWAALATGLPAGASARTLTIDPNNSSVLYLGTLQAGVRKSTNGGASWSNASSGLVAFGIPVTNIVSIAADRLAPSTLYLAAFNGGVYKSTNAGQSWTLASLGLSNPAVVVVAADPVTPGVVYAGTSQGLFVSINGAALWSLAGGGAANTIAFGSGEIFIGTGRAPFNVGSVFRASTGDLHFTAATGGLAALEIDTVVVDPTNPAVLYGGGVSAYKSVDAGATWRNVSGTVGFFSAFLFDPSAPSALYAAATNGVYRTTDGAATWTQLNTGLGSTLVQSLAFDSAAPGTLYAGTSLGVYKTTDAGAHWTATNTGIATAIVFAIASAGGKLYAATNQGLFVSANGGTSWQNAGLPSSEGFFYAVAADPSSPTRILAGAAQGLWQSTDGGVSWSALAFGPDATAVYAILFSGSGSAVLLGTAAGVFGSGDGGATWTGLSDGYTNLAIFALALDSSGNLYAATNGSSIVRLRIANPSRPATFPVGRPRNVRPLAPRG